MTDAWKPQTKAGREFVDWIVGADLRTFMGPMYRSNWTASVMGIEEEAAPGLNQLRHAATDALDWFERGPATNPEPVVAALRAALIAPVYRSSR